MSKLKFMKDLKFVRRDPVVKLFRIYKDTLMLFQEGTKTTLLGDVASSTETNVKLTFILLGNLSLEKSENITIFE